MLSVILSNMKLTLENFKCFTDETIDVDDRFVLVTGSSGCGKSTIFEAIFFAMSGNGKQLVKNGSKSCRVTLTQDDGWIIERTKGPGRLRVFRPKHDGDAVVGTMNHDADSRERYEMAYEDNVAQAMIDKKYSNWELGYLRQGLMKSVVVMTPNDRAQFIEKLVFRETDINAIRKRCCAVETARCNELAVARGEREFRQRDLVNAVVGVVDNRSIDHHSIASDTIPTNEYILDAMAFGDSVTKHDADAWVTKFLDRTTDEKLSVNAERCEEELLESRLLISSLKSELENRRRLETEFASEEESREDAIDYRSTADTTTMMRDFDEALSRIDDAIKRTEKETKRRELATMITSCDKSLAQLNEFDGGDDDNIVLSDESRRTDMKRWIVLARRIDTELDSTRRALREAEEMSKAISIKLTCPACGTIVGYTRDNLIIIDDDTVTATDRDIQRSEMELAKRRCDTVALNDAMRELDALKTKYFGTVDDPVREESKYERYSIQLGARRELLTKRSTYVEQLERLGDNEVDDTVVADSERADGKEITLSRCDVIELRQRRDRVLARRDRAKTLSKFRREVDILESLRAVESREATLVANLSEAKKARRLFAALSKRKLYDEAVDVETKKSDRCDVVRRLIAIIRYAESFSLRNVVESINDIARFYIDKFFSKDVSDIDVKLVIDEQRKIDVVVTHGGYESYVASLSGGELARVSLAFTVAVATMYGVDVLMLDEILAPLDFESADRVIEVLRENFYGRIICVSHQAHSGNFDKVVRLD